MSATLRGAAFWYLLLSSCALTEKQPALVVHYYSMTPSQSNSVRPLPPGNAPSNREERPLRMNRINAGAHLNKKLYFRSSAVEGGYYEDRRWTEKPTVLVHRELARALFERSIFVEQLTGDAPMLAVDVLAFEEVRVGPDRHALVELRFVLRDGASALRPQTVRVERPAVNSSAEEIVKALSLALEDACLELALRLASEQPAEQAAKD